MTTIYPIHRRLVADLYAFTPDPHPVPRRRPPPRASRVAVRGPRCGPPEWGLRCPRLTQSSLVSSRGAPPSLSCSSGARGATGADPAAQRPLGGPRRVFARGRRGRRAFSRVFARVFARCRGLRTLFNITSNFRRRGATGTPGVENVGYVKCGPSERPPPRAPLPLPPPPWGGEYCRRLCVSWRPRAGGRPLRAVGSPRAPPVAAGGEPP